MATTSTISTLPIPYDSIVNSVLIAVSEESGKQATLESDLQSDLNLDSLDYVKLAQHIEDTFQIGPVPDDDLFKLQTVEQVALYVASWLQKKSEIASAVAGRE